MFFPVPVQGKLATEMQRMIADFNKQNAGIKVTPVYTGSYDDTNTKTRAAITAGRPPACAIMSANFIREYVIDEAAIPLDPLIAQDKMTPASFMDQFWPALALNATEQGVVYGVPFQNSTALLYYSVQAFEKAGLDPEKPPVTWQDWVDAGKKLTAKGMSGVVWPNSYDYCGWIFSTLAMSNEAGPTTPVMAAKFTTPKPRPSQLSASSMKWCASTRSCRKACWMRTVPPPPSFPAGPA